MDYKNRFYLFRMGKLVGPVSAAKIDEMIKSKEIHRYSWMMDEVSQKWTPVDHMPAENPFEATMVTLKERILSGAFVNRNHPVAGVVKGIHSFGVELFVEGAKTLSLVDHAAYLLNLIDETNLKASNAEVIYQGQEKSTEGTTLRFTWRDAPTPL